MRANSRLVIFLPTMNLKILLLPGDGIGAEVTRAAVVVLKAVAKKFGHTLDLTEGLLGGIAIHKTGSPFPEETKKLALEADATLMGAVGLPEFDNAPPSQRPEAGLLGIRAVLDVYREPAPRAHLSIADRFVAAQESRRLRHGHAHRARAHWRPVLRHPARDRCRRRRARNTMSYTRPQIERVARRAFELAMNRRKQGHQRR